MEAYAQVLNYAIPFFVILISIEWIIGKRMGMVTNRSMDTISSLSSGLTNSIKDVLGLSIVILSYEWMVDHLAVFHIQRSLWLYVIAFIGLDFAGYWSHRWSHEINVFWNRHIIHHSSEEFNLACALRQSISNIFAIFTFLYIPMAIMGVPVKIVGIVAPLHLFAQFWYHTRLIDRMGWLEKIIVTPSHHRVHHAINPLYIDKNYGQIFIFWDKWFDTYQEERPDEKPVYGVKKPVHTWNPILINWIHFWGILKDAWHTNDWWDKVRIWFMPTGWRPSDVQDLFPVEVITDVHTQEKYNPISSSALKLWSWCQLIITILLMLYLFNRIGDLTLPEMISYGLFLFISIFAYTSLMDRSKWVIVAELCKMVIGGLLIYQMKGWYGLDALLPGGTLWIITYLIISLCATIYFTHLETKFNLELK